MKGYGEMDRVQRMELLFAIGLAVAFIVYFLVIYFGNLDTEVMRDRFWKNADPLFHGEIPVMEYPPFALVFFAIPRIFADTAWGYNAMWVVETYIFTLIGLVLVRRIAEGYGVSQVKAMALYGALMVMFLQFVADRYDIFPAVMTLGSFYLIMVKRAPWAFVLLALATLTKVYPALFIPILMVPYLVDRDWKSMAVGLVAYAGTGLLVTAVCLLIQPELITGFLEYHMDRPLEVGCVTATAIYPFSMLGITDTWILPATEPGSFGSDDLLGPWPDAVAPFLTPMIAVGTVALVLFYWYLRRDEESPEGRVLLVLGAICSVMLIFIVLGKVFSSQYLIWVVPFLALYITVLPKGACNTRLYYLTLVAFVLTQVNFTYIYGITGGGTSINDIAMVSMLVRNLMVVGMLLLILQGMVQVRGSNGSFGTRADPVHSD